MRAGLQVARRHAGTPSRSRQPRAIAFQLTVAQQLPDRRIENGGGQWQRGPQFFRGDAGALGIGGMKFFHGGPDRFGRLLEGVAMHPAIAGGDDVALAAQFFQGAGDFIGGAPAFFLQIGNGGGRAAFIQHLLAPADGIGDGDAPGGQRLEDPGLSPGQADVVEPENLAAAHGCQAGHAGARGIGANDKTFPGHQRQRFGEAKLDKLLFARREFGPFQHRRLRGHCRGADVELELGIVRQGHPA
ncbi:MAG TPA: hypothetical protein VFU81_05260, partial [Thermomicrobiales bacterium]|nr:hypothetical protein [Thermomicrobiales bacterium]